MPTVLSIEGFAFRIYHDDHEPPHVHVFRAGEQCVVNLGDGDTLPSLRETYMSRAHTRRAMEIAYENQDYLLRKWDDING